MGMRDLLARGVPVYAYFNNDAQGWAVHNAKLLAQMLDAGVSRGGTAATSAKCRPVK